LGPGHRARGAARATVVSCVSPEAWTTFPGPSARYRGQSRCQIRGACAYYGCVESVVRDLEPGPMYEAPRKPAERDHRRGRRARPGDQALVHSDPAWGVALMEAVSLTERDVAGTLRAMAQAGAGEAAARLLRRAEAAIRGSRGAA